MGFIGRTAPDSHEKAYIDCEHTEVVATCDLQSSWIYPHYYDHIEMMEQDLDIVSVCTPVETHCQIVKDIAPYCSAIYLEKPMASTLEECREMIAVCEDEETILQVNHQRRFVKPLFRFARDMIGTGTHVMDWLRQYHIDADIEYVDTQDHIFELVITRDRMILAGVEWLVRMLDCPDTPKKSDGVDGWVALSDALRFKENYGRTN